MRRRTELAQIAGALLVALAIAAIAIWIVTDHFGPTSAAQLEAREDRIDARIDAREELREEREEAREEREEGSGGNSGPG
jgi:F0F1-type ATP synthase membrane subunit b/b'